MPYEPKPGSLSLFKNDRKEKDSHPDYRGDGLDLDGRPVWVSAWVKQGAKGKFFSLSLQPKEEKRQERGGGNYGQASRGREDQRRQAHDSFPADLDDDIPFITRESVL